MAEAIPDALQSQVKTYAERNECKRTYSKSDCSCDLTKVAMKDGLYGSIMSPITCWCHHFTEDGRHCVTVGAGPEEAKQCHGVMWGSIWTPTTLTCGPPRGGKDKKKHTVCNEDRCPFVKAGYVCPYTSTA